MVFRNNPSAIQANSSSSTWFPWIGPTLFEASQAGVGELWSLIMCCVQKQFLLSFLIHPGINFIEWPLVLVCWEGENSFSAFTLSTLCTILYTSIMSPLMCLLSRLKSPKYLNFPIGKLVQPLVPLWTSLVVLYPMRGVSNRVVTASSHDVSWLPPLCSTRI